MQRTNYALLSLLAFLSISLTSCEAIQGIFKAGIWTGLILVAVVIAIVIWLITKFK